MCRSKNPEIAPKVESAAPGIKADTQNQLTPHQVGDSYWACGAHQEESVDHQFKTYQDPNTGFYEGNKNSEVYTPCFNATPQIMTKEVPKKDEKIGVTHPGPKRGKIKCKKIHKKVGLPTLVNNKVTKGVITVALAMLTGSAILSSLPSDSGSMSKAQVAEVRHGELVLGHHVYHRGRGWLKQAARVKPVVQLYSRLDMGAYKALGLKPPAKQAKVSGGQHLADTGASICLGGRTYLRSLGLCEEDLTPCDMTVSGANNSNIKVLGALLVELSRGSSQGDLTTKQIIYICEGVVGALLSFEACVDLGLVRDDFPQTCVSVAGQGSRKNPDCECKCPVREEAPDVPVDMPMLPTPQNIPKLQAWIMNYYASSAFNCCECQPLPAMHGPPLTIHMQDGVKPIASHSPIPVPVHWQKKVKSGLDRDEAIGVIERVPPGTPTTWCHKMVVVPKKDNTPRRTVNFQPLNQFSSRQTHHTVSPFHQATSVPKNKRKTVLDAWNGYHSVYLDPSCRDLTTFITPWGRYRYKTTPQGYMAAGDAYTERFDRIITDFENKTKCVDDTLLWSSGIEESFRDTCRFLTHCSRNGIVFNPTKFQFCQEEVDFAGFTIGPNFVKPAPKILESIRTFPIPKNISDVRGWFGLVNQVAPFFASRPVMQPFRELLKPAAKGKQIYWDDNLTKLFEESKEVIIEAIESGIKTFEQGKWTCLLTDYSKTGIGFFLMQKKCKCQDITPYCCKTGWQLVLAGSRFTNGAESRYAPVEGETLAVEWGLEATKHYTLGNPKLLVATDHKPLLKILGDRKLEDIPNPRLVNLKEKTLRWHFDIIHIPGKIHIGPDTMSRREVTANLVTMMGNREDDQGCKDREIYLEYKVSANIPHPISWQQLREHVSKDSTLQMLSDQISSGFPPEKKLLRLELREYWHHRDVLTQVDGVPLFKNRVIIPKSLRPEVLDTLHSAHQGVSGMNERAQNSVWWPGITPQIQEKRDKCRTCNEHMPSQPSAPPLPLQQPDYPFQQIVSDYFQEQGHHYLVIADRFSGWPTLLFCGGSTASSSLLIDTLKTYFSTYGIPEELSSDGGPTYMAYETQKFLSNYGVHHRVSSMAFPHSNQRAELAVKSMKRLLRENIGGDGKLNTDSFQRAVMQYRNTPDRDTGRSPSQVIFGREIRDFLPAPLSRYKPQKQWLLLQEDREKALSKRALRNMEQLNMRTRKLLPLQVRDIVQVQNQVGFKASRWDVTGEVVEVKPYDQYLVKIHGSGRVTLRNRKFLKKITPYGQRDGMKPQVQPHLLDVENDPKPGQEHQPADSQADTEPIKVSPSPDLISNPNDPSVGPKDDDVTEVGDQQGDPVQPVPVQPVPDQAALRRSTRTSAAPERLNIESWKGQSYSAVGQSHKGNEVVHNVGHVKQDPRLEQYLRDLGAWYCNMTAPYSVTHSYGLLHSVPWGGGGISGYTTPSVPLPQHSEFYTPVPGSYQAKYSPYSPVHNTGLPGYPQLVYGPQW